MARADYAVGITSVSATVCGSITYTNGPLVTSVVMLKGVFRKVTAHVGAVGRIVGLAYGITVFVPHSSSVLILLAIAFILLGVWLLPAGSRLYRLGKQ